MFAGQDETVEYQIGLKFSPEVEKYFESSPCFMKMVVTEMIVAKFAFDISPKTLFQWSPANKTIYGPLKGKQKTTESNIKSHFAFIQQ